MAPDMVEVGTHRAILGLLLADNYCFEKNVAHTDNTQFSTGKDIPWTL